MGREFPTNAKTENAFLKRLLTSLAALGVAGIIATSEKADAIDTDILPISSSPYEASQFLRSYSLQKGDNYESLILSVKEKDNWKTMAVKGNKLSIGQENFYSAASKIGVTPGDTSKVVVTQHNHSYELIVGKDKSLAIDKVKSPELILEGPSLYDCIKFKGDGKSDHIRTLNVITEPGGYWVCGDYDLNSFEKIADQHTYEQYLKTRKNTTIFRALDILRKKLVIDSQENDPLKRAKIIKDFEENFFNLTKMRLKYLPSNVSKEEYEKTLKSFE